jgi:hypothetical protein
VEAVTAVADLLDFYPDMPKFDAPALCAQTDPTLFTDLDWGVNFNDARGICSRCEAQPECLKYALSRGLNHDDDGMWAGTTPQERRRMKANQVVDRAGNLLPPINHGTESGARTHQRRGEKACDECLKAARDARKGRAKSS